MPGDKRRVRVIERSADAALAAMPVPLRMLDVGSGTGALLREMIVRVPNGEAYVGVDSSHRTAAAARRNSDARISFLCARAEALPFPDAHFDLVVSSMSFGHWTDQRRGVEELARVVHGTGTVVLVDRSAAWLRPDGRAHTPKAMTQLLVDAGLHVRKRESVYRTVYGLPCVQAFIARP